MFSSSFQWNFELKHVLDLVTTLIVRDLHENEVRKIFFYELIYAYDMLNEKVTCLDLVKTCITFVRFELND